MLRLVSIGHWLIMVSRKDYWGALSLLETPLIRVLMLAGISDGGYNVKESIFAGICLVVSQDTIGLMRVGRFW